MSSLAETKRVGRDIHGRWIAVASAWRDACRRRFKSTLSTARTSENQRVRFRRRIYSGRWKRTVSRRRVAFLVGESRFPCRLHARIIALVPIFDLPSVCAALTVSLASFKDRVEPTATRRPFFLLLYLRYRLPSKSPACRGFYRRASVGFSAISIVRVPDPSEIVWEKLTGGTLERRKRRGQAFRHPSRTSRKERRFLERARARLHLHREVVYLAFPGRQADEAAASREFLGRECIGSRRAYNRDICILFR